MFLIEKDGNIYVYRSVGYMLKAVLGTHSAALLSDYIILIDPMDRNMGRLIKDRSGVFSMNHNIRIEKILKIIAHLYEEENFKQKDST